MQLKIRPKNLKQEIAKVNKTSLYNFEILITEKRNKDLINMLNQRHCSLDEAGRYFSLSRERVRQIYEREVGGKYDLGIKERKKIKEEIKNTTIKFVCSGCEKKITVSDRSGYKKRKFCKECKDWMVKTGRDLTKIRFCKICKDWFFPFRNIGYGRGKGDFCSKECYRTIFGKQSKGRRDLPSFYREINCASCNEKILARCSQKYCKNCSIKARKKNKLIYNKTYYQKNIIKMRNYFNERYHNHKFNGIGYE